VAYRYEIAVIHGEVSEVRRGEVRARKGERQSALIPGRSLGQAVFENASLRITMFRDRVDPVVWAVAHSHPRHRCPAAHLLKFYLSPLVVALPSPSHTSGYVPFAALPPA
jgi:hypothetical protein